MALPVVDIVSIIASILGFIAFIVALLYQTAIINIHKKSKYLSYWKIARTLTLVLSFGYVVQIVSLLFQFDDLTKWIIPFAYLFGGLFVLLISSLIAMTSQERSVYVKSIEKLERDRLNLINQMNESVNLISKTSEDLIESSDVLNQFASVVVNSTRGISSGAVQQSEMIGNITNKLNSSRREIEDIIFEIHNSTETILDISDNSNILSLNAVISSNRAGEFGKEFRVVAENFKSFSDETNQSAENVRQVSNEIERILQTEIAVISSDIENMLDVSQETTASTQELVSSTNEMDSILKNISSMIVELNNQAEKSVMLIKQIHE